MAAVLILTAPGLEDLVQNEAISLLKSRHPGLSTIKGRRGKGWLELHPPAEADAAPLFCSLRTAFRIIELKAETKHPGDEILHAAKACAEKGGFRELRYRPPFRIRCYVQDEPSGTRAAVERAVGAVAVEQSGAPVNLNQPEIEYGVEILDGHIFYGILWKDEDETPRYRKQFQVRSSVKPHIAAAMLNLVGFQARPGSLLDPCCGSGTILLEAGMMHPGTRLYGSDVDERCAQGAQKNLSALSQADPGSRIYEGDARHLEKLFPSGSLDYLVTNPPFGIRTGTRINFYWFYRELLQGADRILSPKGRIALLVGRKRGIFNRALEEEGHFMIQHVRVIDASGLFPALYVLGRKK